MRVLVPVDGSERSRRAVEHALELYGDDSSDGRADHERESGVGAGSTDIVLLNVLDFGEAGYESAPGAELPGQWSDWHEQAKDSAEAIFTELEEAFEREFETDAVVGRPARAIVEYAEDNGVDAIVMGSHGREGVSRILLGSVAETVVRRAPVPVTVVR